MNKDVLYVSVKKKQLAIYYNCFKTQNSSVALLVKYYVVIKNYAHTRPVGLVMRTGGLLETATLLLKMCAKSHTLNHVLDWGGDFCVYTCVKAYQIVYT